MEGLSVEKLSERCWRVKNPKHQSEYLVVYRGTRLECHCRGFVQFRKCIHVDAVIGTFTSVKRGSEDIPEPIPVPDSPEEIKYWNDTHNPLGVYEDSESLSAWPPINKKGRKI